MSMERNVPGFRAACFCTCVIGIGYLFPIAAIWAAFDYWKTVFPDENIEFSVTLVYQIFSLVTVMVLSVVPSTSFGPRIVGGFCGQFACLLVVFMFRWLQFATNTLLIILLTTVTFCACATGLVDSAVFSLCSQYDSSIQSYLQLGIGGGTLVSVLYRDSTKLLMSGDTADATTAYFSVALVTVLICIACYRVLMELPISKIALNARERARKLLSSGATPPQSPVIHACFTPTSPALWQDLQSTSDSSAMEAGREQAQKKMVSKEVPVSDVSHASFRRVFPLVWYNQLTICLNLFLTTLCYPGLLTSIPCKTFTSLRKDQWFSTLVLTVFTLSDIIARLWTHKRFCVNHRNVFITVLLRSVIFPMMIFCIRSDWSTDILSFVVVSMFGALNGWCVSTSLIVVNEIPDLTSEQRKTCGRISACSVNSGLALGSLAATFVAAGLGLEISGGA